ncbi:MAG: hypothetical protein RIC95_14055 [Vicingaceae bacterium]
MKTGIWIDFDKAYIIELDKNKEGIKKIDSNIEHFHLHGGSRSKMAYGPQDNVSESKLLARNQQQQKSFYKTVINQINAKANIVVFGPAEAKVNLKKAILNVQAFKDKNIPVEACDSMTENQMKAWVRNYTP